MKLSTIQNVHHSEYPLKLYTLFKESTSDTAMRCQYALSFINIITESRPIREAGSDRLGSLLKTGYSKLQAALAPNISDDIGPILAIMVPQSGGVETVKKLVEAAGQSSIPIIDNQNWTTRLFNAFGIYDKQTQSNIIQQLKSSQNTTPSQPTQAGSRQPTQTRSNQPAKTNEIARAIEAERAETTNSIQAIKDTLDLISTNRVNATQELAKINAKIKELMARSANRTTESILDDLVYQLLNESVVRQNIGEANIGQFGQKIGKILSNIPKTAKQAMRGLRHFATNPQYASAQLDQQQVKDNNILIAKHLVQILSDKAKERFNSTIRQAGYNRDEIIEMYLKWQQMKQQNDASPQFRTISQQLDKISKLFSRGESPFL